VKRESGGSMRAGRGKYKKEAVERVNV